MTPGSILAVLALVGCGDKPEPPKPDAAGRLAPIPAPAAPVQEPLVGGPYPTLLLAQAQFSKGPDGKAKPGAALVTLWRQTPDGWKSSKLEDGASNVFHKAMAHEGAIYTIGAEDAWLKRWRFEEGTWRSEGLWNPSWGGKFDRIRDLEIGDVDHDGKDDLVMATHDFGVVAVGRFDTEGKLVVTELDRAADTFVHEIEVGDIDGDGKKEFFATPTGRNRSSGESQPGDVVMYRWDGTTFVRTVVEHFEGRHAKELLATDVDGDGKSEFYGVIEAETKIEGGKPVVSVPVEVRQYLLQKDGTFKAEVRLVIEDRQTRFLVPGDFDHDGDVDLIAAAMDSGLWIARTSADGKWVSEVIDRASSGYEHAAWGADLDGDGKLELYVAADNQKELRRYLWDAGTKSFVRTPIGPIPAASITWNITSTAI